MTAELPAATTDAGTTAPTRLRRVIQISILAAPPALLLVMGWIHRTIVEDGFIYLRVTEQVGAGNGPVFNAGERVEATTGTLWLAVLAVADLVTPIQLEWLAVFLGLGGSVVGLTLATIGARRLWDQPLASVWFVPFGALVFVALLPTWQYATTGLETGLVFLWLGACLVILVGWSGSTEQRLSLPGAVVLGLGWLVRPELVIFSAVFLVGTLVLQWSQDRWTDRLRLVAAMIAVPVAYQLFRMGYYGSLVPSTAIAKEGSRVLWARGWDYLRDFVDTYWLWVPVLALVAGGYVPLAARLRRDRRTRAQFVLIAFVLGAVLEMLYVVVVGGDYAHARLLLPSLFAVCAPIAVVPLARQNVAGLILVPWVIAAAFVLRPPVLNDFVVLTSAGNVTIEDYGWGDDGPSQAWYTGSGYYIAGATELFGYRQRDPELRDDIDLPYGVFAGVGISSYAPGIDLHVMDIMGLADPLAAHLEIDPDFESYPGHEKPLPAPWIAARLTPPDSRPDPADFPVSPLLPATAGRQWQEQVAWARAALDCSEIRRILRGADTPMTPGRFVYNLRRSFGNTQVRIPADPEEAYHRFCGDGTPPEVRAVRSS